MPEASGGGSGAALAPATSATVWWLAAGRLPCTTAIRMMAPLLGVLAAGLGTSVVRASVMIAVLEAAGFTSPAAGWLVDRLGAARMVVASLALLALGALGLAAAPGLLVFAGAMAVVGLAITGFDASSTAWVAHAAGDADRATWVVRLDVAWASGLLVGVPIVAALSLWTWRAGYVAIAAGATLLAVLLAPRLRAGERARSATHEAARWRWASVRRGLPVFAAFGCMAAASQFVVVSYGVWLEDRHGFSTGAIGAVAFCFGAGDLLATGTALRWTGRLGPLRAATLGSCTLAAGAVLLVLGAGHLVTGLAALAVLLLGFEFGLLSTKPLLTEVDPAQRGLGIGLGFGAAAACRSASAVGGAALYDAGGLRWSAAASVVAALVTVGLLRLQHRVARPS